jgi:hypothetical protein
VLRLAGGRPALPRGDYCYEAHEVAGRDRPVPRGRPVVAVHQPRPRLRGRRGAGPPAPGRG